MSDRSIVEPQIDDSMMDAASWKLSEVKSWIISTASAVVQSLQASATKKGGLQIEAKFKFLDGPNAGRVANKWVGLQTVSAQQVNFMQKDCRHLLGNRVVGMPASQLLAFVGQVFIDKDIDAANGDLQSTDEGFMNPHFVVSTDGFAALASRQEGNVVKVRVSKLNSSGFPDLQVQHFIPALSSVEEWTAQKALAAKQAADRAAVASATK